MNLDALWQTHRRFLLGVAAGLLIFLVAKALIGGTLRAPGQEAEARIGNYRRSLRTPAYDAAAENRLKGHRQELLDRIGDLEGRVLPPWRDEFRPGAGQAPGSFYIEVSGRLRSDLIPRALRANVEVDPSLGLPAVSPSASDVGKIERLLRGLDVVERVVNLAVAHRARTVDDVEIETRTRSVRRPGMPEPALNLTPVSLEVVLREENAWAFAMDVVNADPPLGYEGLEVGPPDPKRGERVVRLRLVVGEVPEPEAGR